LPRYFFWKILWNKLGITEQWWVGIRKVESEYVVFHKYERADLPLHRGIFLIDIAAGDLIWSDANIKSKSILKALKIENENSH
jgi:hypothetical protein